LARAAEQQSSRAAGKTYRFYQNLPNQSGVIPIQNPSEKIRAIKMGTLGSPDIIVCSPSGRFVAIECKGSTGRLTKIQKAFLEELRKNNALVIVTKDVNDLIKNGI